MLLQEALSLKLMIMFQHSMQSTITGHLRWKQPESSIQTDSHHVWKVVHASSRMTMSYQAVLYVQAQPQT